MNVLYNVIVHQVVHLPRVAPGYMVSKTKNVVQFITFYLQFKSVFSMMIDCLI